MTRLYFFWIFLSFSPLFGDLSEASAPAKDKKPKGPTIIQVLERAGQYNTLIACIQEAGLVERLSETGPYTLFAPTDEAFVRLYPGTIERWLQLAHLKELRAVLLYHLVEGKLTLDQIRRAQTLRSVEGALLTVTPSFQATKIEDATMGKGLEAVNGIIYPIDQVLQPTLSRSGGLDL